MSTMNFFKLWEEKEVTHLKKKSLRGKNQMMIFNIHLFIEKIRHNLWVQGKPNYVTVANNGRYVGQHQLRKILIH